MLKMSQKKKLSPHKFLKNENESKPKILFGNTNPEMSYIHFWTLKCFICLKMTIFYYFLNAKKILIFGYFLPKIELWTPKKGKKK